MKNYWLSVCVCGLSILLTGCFEISEDIYVRKNGSGRYTAQFNFSSSKAMIQTLILSSIQLGKKNPFGTETNPLDQVEELLKEGVSKLPSPINGIRNATPKLDRQNLIYGIEFEFDNMKALNEYLARSIQIENAPAYEWRKKTITRPHYFYFDAITMALEPWLSSDRDMTQYKQIIYDQLQYKCIIRTEKPIKTFFPKDHYVLNPEKTEIVLQKPVKDIREGKVNLGVTVKTK